MRIIYILILCFWSSLGFSQYYLEFGVAVGGANYLGEIGGTDQPGRDWIYDMRLSQTRTVVGGFVRYKVGHNIAFNFGVNYATLQGADSLTDYPERFGRNLSFRNNIIENYNRVEYIFLSVNDVGRTGRYKLAFKAYLYSGVGFFYNNPKAFYQGRWVALQPLNTEGPGREYSRIQPNVPLGFGMYYTFDRKHRFGWQLGWRFTFTDYIDDISTFYADPDALSNDLAVALADRSGEVSDDPRSIGSRFYSKGAIRGNPSNNDSYIFTSFTYSYVIRGRAKRFPKRRGNYITGRRVGRTKAKF